MIERMPSTTICSRSRAGSANIGGRPSLVCLRPIDQVFEVITHITAMFAVEWSVAMHPHFLQRIFGEAEPNGSFLGGEKRFVRHVFLVLCRHRWLRATFAPSSASVS